MKGLAARVGTWALQLFVASVLLVAGFGALALVVAGANELFSLGWWTDDYPVAGADDAEGSFGQFFGQTALLTLAAGAVGGVLLKVIPESALGLDDE